ncbi:COX15/CtaA family protein [Aquimarina sp. ERC-38]|nr:COX15/CtaA family protein [Aquimarina sp. ERC-38]
MFKKLTVISIILIYLIIVAGAVVRMTGSGMGCPDWPKCFGYYIPPTSESQIQWKPEHLYKQGTIVIKNEELRLAKENFTSTSQYQEDNWLPYTKHDYAEFNVWHTWIEYINRLVTVLSGLPILLLFILSFRYLKTNKRITQLAIITVLAMAFQAWLGKIVVDTNLAPVRITVHMLVAFLIAAILIMMLYEQQPERKKVEVSKTFKSILVFSIILTFIQVAMGTQVRQYVDEQVKLALSKSEWLTPTPVIFYVHRSFSVLIVLVNAWLFLQNRKLSLGLTKLNWVMFLIALEVITGIAMYYLDFPFLTQPLHLVIASLLFGIQFYLLLQVFYNRKQSVLLT